MAKVIVQEFAICTHCDNKVEGLELQHSVDILKEVIHNACYYQREALNKVIMKLDKGSEDEALERSLQFDNNIIKILKKEEERKKSKYLCAYGDVDTLPENKKLRKAAEGEMPKFS